MGGRLSIFAQFAAAAALRNLPHQFRGAESVTRGSVGDIYDITWQELLGEKIAGTAGMARRLEYGAQVAACPQPHKPQQLVHWKTCHIRPAAPTMEIL